MRLMFCLIDVSYQIAGLDLNGHQGPGPHCGAGADGGAARYIPPHLRNNNFEGGERENRGYNSGGGGGGYGNGGNRDFRGGDRDFRNDNRG